MGNYDITGEETRESPNNDDWLLCKRLLQVGGPTSLTAAATYEIVTGNISDTAIDLVNSAYNPSYIHNTYEIVKSLGL